MDNERVRGALFHAISHRLFYIPFFLSSPLSRFNKTMRGKLSAGREAWRRNISHDHFYILLFLWSLSKVTICGRMSDSALNWRTIACFSLYCRSVFLRPDSPRTSTEFHGFSKLFFFIWFHFILLKFRVPVTNLHNSLTTNSYLRSTFSGASHLNYQTPERRLITFSWLFRFSFSRLWHSSFVHLWKRSQVPPNGCSDVNLCADLMCNRKRRPHHILFLQGTKVTSTTASTTWLKGDKVSCVTLV